MSALIWEEEPTLERPIIITAFGGWNDAGEAATGAVRFLIDQWNATSFASIDPEDFFDFTETRPTVRMDNGLVRRIDWPINAFYAGRIADRNQDIILLEGTEPQLKWRTFCAAVLELAEVVDASMVVSLGALLADVPHTREAPSTANTNDRDLLERLGLEPTRYEGPTGITGVLADSCAKAERGSVSIWASVPHYVSATPSPKGTMALVQRTCEVINAPIDVSMLQTSGRIYEEQVSEVVAEDEDMVEYVQQLEAAIDTDQNSVELLAREAERFLRDQND